MARQITNADLLPIWPSWGLGGSWKPRIIIPLVWEAWYDRNYPYLPTYILRSSSNRRNLAGKAGEQTTYTRDYVPANRSREGEVMEGARCGWMVSALLWCWKWGDLDGHPSSIIHRSIPYGDLNCWRPTSHRMWTEMLRKIVARSHCRYTHTRTATA